jgi:hypothetical protein
MESPCDVHVYDLGAARCGLCGAPRPGLLGGLHALAEALLEQEALERRLRLEDAELERLEARQAAPPDATFPGLFGEDVPRPDEPGAHGSRRR